MIPDDSQTINELKERVAQIENTLFEAGNGDSDADRYNIEESKGTQVTRTSRLDELEKRMQQLEQSGYGSEDVMENDLSGLNRHIDT